MLGFVVPEWARAFYETPDDRIMVLDYTVVGASVPGKPRVWYCKQLFDPGTSNLDISPTANASPSSPCPKPRPAIKARCM